MLDWIFSVVVPRLVPVFQGSLSQIEKGVCLARCNDVVQTQGYHLVYIWGSLIKSQGGWGCSKVHALR